MPKTSEGDEDKSPSQLKEGEPIARLVDRETGKTLGWEYRWNTGETGTLWVKEASDDFDYEPLAGC